VTDAVDEAFLRGLPIPDEARDALRRGVPRDVRLPGWLGPTVFSSGVVEGRLLCDGDEIVLGAIRETQGVGEGRPYAEFRLRPDGAVVLVDLDPDARVTPVSASLPRFWAGLDALLRHWEDPDALEAALRAIDPAVLDDPDGYWAMWLEDRG
jgi:hypothetical protein